MGVEFDDLMDELGHFGLYQIIVWLQLCVLQEIVLGLDISFMVFAAAAPDWWCSIQADNGTVYNSTDCAILHSCENIHFAEDINTLGTEFRLYCSTGFVADALPSIQIGGILVGALFWGQLAESYGRYWVTLACTVIGILVGFLLSFAPSWQIFAVGLFLLGSCLGGYWCVSFIYQQEIVGVKFRTFTFLVSGWIIGGLVSAGLQWYFHDWRRILFWVNLIGIGSLPGFLIFVRESPRWLLEHEHYEQARTVIAYIAKMNGRPAPKHTEALIAHSKKKVAQTKTKTRKKYSFWHLFYTKKLSIIMCTMLVSWFVSAFVSWGLYFNIKSLPGNRYLNMLISGSIGAVENLITYAASAKLPRKVVHQLSLIGMLVCLAMVTISYEFLEGVVSESTRNHIITWFALLGGTMSGPSWMCNYLYTSELFPTVLRPLSNSAGSVAARIGGMLGPVVLSTGSTWKSFPYVIWMCAIVIDSVLVCAFIPETKDRPLNDHLPPRKKSLMRQQEEIELKSIENGDEKEVFL